MTLLLNAQKMTIKHQQIFNNKEPRNATSIIRLLPIIKGGKSTPMKSRECDKAERLMEI